MLNHQLSRKDPRSSVRQVVVGVPSEHLSVGVLLVEDLVNSSDLWNVVSQHVLHPRLERHGGARAAGARPRELQLHYARLLLGREQMVARTRSSDALDLPHIVSWGETRVGFHLVGIYVGEALAQKRY